MTMNSSQMKQDIAMLDAAAKSFRLLASSSSGDAHIFYKEEMHKALTRATELRKKTRNLNPAT